MDTLNCPSGWASDRVMLYGDDFVPGSCEVPIGLYVGLFSTLTAVRALTVGFQFHAWFDREKRVQLRTGKTRNRLPLLPMLSLTSLVALLLFTVLTSLNIANGSNGGSLFLLLIYYFPSSLGSFVLIFRVVKLGKKLIPLANMRLEGSENEKRLSRLSEATVPLKVFYVLDTLAVLITPIGAIIGLAMPVYATFQAAVAGYAAQDLLLGWGVALQYQRVISAIKACQFNARPGEGPADDLNKAIFRLRQQQVGLFLLGPLVALLWIVNIARVLLPYFWVVFLQLLAEVLIIAVFTMSHAKTSCFKRNGIFKATVTDESSGPGRPLQVVTMSTPQLSTTLNEHHD